MSEIQAGSYDTKESGGMAAGVVEFFSSMKEKPTPLTEQLKKNLLEFFNTPNVSNFNVYDLIVKFQAYGKQSGVNISGLKNFFKENVYDEESNQEQSILDEVLVLLFDTKPDFSANLICGEERLSQFIEALLPKLKELLKKESLESIYTVKQSLSSQFFPLEMYLLDERVNQIITGFFKKSIEFVLEEIELIENVHREAEYLEIPSGFVSSTIAHLCSDFGTEASMQQLFALIVDRAFAEGIDAQTLICFLQNQNIEQILLNRVLFYANEGYFENGKKEATGEIREEINAYIEHFSSHYKPTYQKYTFIATVKKLAQKYRDYDVLSYLKAYPSLRGLINDRIPTVVDDLYVESCKQRLNKMDEDESSKLRAVAKTQFSRIFYYIDAVDNECFIFNIEELHKLFNKTLPRIYDNGKQLNYAEFRSVIGEMMIECIKAHPGIITLKVEVSDEVIASSIVLNKDVEETVRCLVEDNARTMNGDSELFDPLTDPTRTPLALEELAEKFIIDEKVDLKKYEDYLLRHHSCHEFDPLHEIEVLEKKLLSLLEMQSIEELSEDVELVIARIRDKIRQNQNGNENNKERLIEVIKNRLSDLFIKADEYLAFLEEKSGGMGFYISEKVKTTHDLAELTLLAINGKDEVERFEARRKISLALRMDRISKSGAFVFLDRNIDSIKRILSSYLEYENSVVEYVPFYDHPKKGIALILDEPSQKRQRLSPPPKEYSFTEQDKEYIREVKLIPATFSGVKCWILPSFSDQEIEIIRKKSLQSITTKQLRNRTSADLAAMTLVAKGIKDLEELTRLIQKDFLAYGKVLSIENKMGDLIKLRTKNVSINSSSSNEYRSIHYVVEMVIYDPETQRELITTIEVRVILIDDLVKEKSLFHAASHQIYEKIRLGDVIKLLVPREIYTKSYETSEPNPWDIHGDKQEILKKKS
jgi:hypothetical protein